MTTITNNKLTDEEITALALKLFDGSSFYFQSGRRPGAKTMAELLNKAASAVAELQERRKADSADPAGYHVIKECGKVGCSVTTLEEAEKTRDFWNKKWIIRPYFYTPPASEREQIRREHAEWSDATFGDVGPIGPLKHLSKEALETAAEPDDLSEWADMQFLLWDAQRRAGITDEQITQAMTEKLAINKTRQWPEPKDGEPRLHIKEQPAPVVPDEWTIQDAVKFCRETGRQDAGSAMEAWNACRAAMLNAEPLHATPKGNRLRIAEGKLAEYSLSKREPQPTPESADRKMLKRLAVIMSGSDSGGEISALTVTAQSLVDRCKALALSTSQEPQPLTLANETMDVERLREIAEEDNGSDVKFECSVMARMLLSVALNSDPVAYTDAEELESLEGVDGHSYAHLWPNSYGFGKDIALYTVPQMMPLPVNILDDETNRDVFEAWVADYTGHTKGFVRQFRVDDKYRSDSMWNKYWNTWNACRAAMLSGGKS